jgi:hypothetical protein
MGGSGYMKEAGNEPGMGTVNSSGAPTNQTGPTTVTAPTQSYGFGQYQTPTYAYTPQSGYSGLAQQLQQAQAQLAGDVVEPMLWKAAPPKRHEWDEDATTPA